MKSLSRVAVMKSGYAKMSFSSLKHFSTRRRWKGVSFSCHFPGRGVASANGKRVFLLQMLFNIKVKGKEKEKIRGSGLLMYSRQAVEFELKSLMKLSNASTDALSAAHMFHCAFVIQSNEAGFEPREPTPAPRSSKFHSALLISPLCLCICAAIRHENTSLSFSSRPL